MKTARCHTLGIEHPIIAAPMGPDLTGPDLVAAVRNAGGLGILQAQFCPPQVFRQQIRRVRALTAKPFGVNLLLHFPVEDHVAICLEERVWLGTFRQIPSRPLLTRLLGLAVVCGLGSYPFNIIARHVQGYLLVQPAIFMKQGGERRRIIPVYIEESSYNVC